MSVKTFESELGATAGDIDELSGFWALIKLNRDQRVRAGERCDISPGTRAGR